MRTTAANLPGSQQRQLKMSAVFVREQREQQDAEDITNGCETEREDTGGGHHPFENKTKFGGSS